MIREFPFFKIEGICTGHAQNDEAMTGCTVIIAENGATAGVDVRGGAPGTRETDLLRPVNLVQKIHAVLLTGGSAFGLDAAAGVMQYLEERGIGFDMQVARIPIVCAAVLFDLAIGDAGIRPDKAMGYQACLSCGRESSGQGNIGAGTGALVGKILGMQYAMKGGLGDFAVQLEDIQIGAMVAVNCLGDVVDSNSGKTLAGLLGKDRKSVMDTEKEMIRSHLQPHKPIAGNTTIGVVVTNVKLNKTEATRLATVCQNGIARSIRPAHTQYDGDTIFVLSTGNAESDINLLGVLGVQVVEKAITSAVKHAKSVRNLISYSDL
jgi:L-aminopeptidase/D-esterase-like protein